MITNLFLALGLTRDSSVFVWGRLLALCGLIGSHVFDIGAQLAALGVPIGAVGVHRIEVLAIVVLWLASVNGTSPLPGAPKS